jgi:hypothetical protein
LGEGRRGGGVAVAPEEPVDGVVGPALAGGGVMADDGVDGEAGVAAGLPTGVLDDLEAALGEDGLEPGCSGHGLDGSGRRR